MPRLRFFNDVAFQVETRRKAYKYAQPMFWPNVGRQYLEFFEQVAADSDMSRQWPYRNAPSASARTSPTQCSRQNPRLTRVSHHTRRDFNQCAFRRAQLLLRLIGDGAEAPVLPWWESLTNIPTAGRTRIFANQLCAGGPVMHVRKRNRLEPLGIA